MLCTTPSTSGANVDTTGIRFAAIRSSTAAVIDLVDVADQADVGVDAVDADAAPHRGEQLGVLAGDTDGIGPVRVDQVDQFAADLTEQHHPGHIEHFRCGDAESAFEVAGDAQPAQHGGDLRSAAVHDDGMDAAVTQKSHVGGERLAAACRRSWRCRRI